MGNEIDAMQRAAQHSTALHSTLERLMEKKLKRRRRRKTGRLVQADIDAAGGMEGGFSIRLIL